MISGDKITLEVPVYIDVDFEIDEDGVLRTVVVLDTGDENDNAQEIYTDFEETVDSIIAFYAGEETGFFNLYALSSELHRIADKINLQAGLMDDVGGYKAAPDDFGISVDDI